MSATVPRRDVTLTDAELLAVGVVMDHAGVQLSGPLRSSLIAGGHSNLTHRLSDDVRAWVMRTPPLVGKDAFRSRHRPGVSRNRGSERY